MSAQSVAIDIKGLSISYDRKRVLSNIFLKIEEGYTYGLIGPNGAGKSTLFKAILGIIQPNSGEIEVLGRNVKGIRKKIAYVPQKDDVDWDFPATVRDIVLMGRYPHKKLFSRINQKDKRIASEAMAQLGISDLAERQIGALSGGQQQRVFIARAICQDADIFLMDEPFVGVDMTTEHRIIEIMKDLAIAGKTIMVVHHDLNTADDYFDKVILLNQRLIAVGDTIETFTKENIAMTYAPQMKILQEIGLIDEKLK
jgi:ABC-type Mn/Zn transport systems, ATPase component